jgi:hypothetical protein
MCDNTLQFHQIHAKNNVDLYRKCWNPWSVSQYQKLVVQKHVLL